MTGADVLRQVREALLNSAEWYDPDAGEKRPVFEDLVAALDGCILLTREEAARVRAALRMTSTIYAEPARALLTPEPAGDLGPTTDYDDMEC